MKTFKGRYNLIKEDIGDGTKEVFDFADRVMDFACLKDKEAADVSVATIDSLTTVFPDIHYLYSYLNKEIMLDRETEGFSSYVRYKSRSTGCDAFLSTVWDDEVLHEIASNANGSKVNFENQTTKDVFSTMYNELRDSDSGFGSSLLNSSSNDTSINSHNRKLVGVASYGSDVGEFNFFSKMRNGFSSYREYRALYIAYCKYMKSLKKEVPFIPVKK